MEVDRVVDSAVNLTGFSALVSEGLKYLGNGHPILYLGTLRYLVCVVIVFGVA